MIQRIRIQRYKSLRDVEVKLRSLAVLFGPNAAAKSNFIDALQLLSRIAGSRSLKEAFEPPYRGKPLESFSFEASGLQAFQDRETVSFSLEVDMDLSPAVIAAVNKEILETRRGQTVDGASDSRKPASYIHHTQLRYRIEVGINPKSGVLHVSDEYLAALGRDGTPKARPQPFLVRSGHRLHLRMEGQSHPTYFERFLDHAIVSRPHYPPHYPHLVALKKELQSWFFYYFEPRERMRAPTSVKEVRHIGLMGEELAAFLNTLKNLDPRQFGAVERAMHSLIPSITGIQTEVNKAGEVELSLMEGNVPMPASVISEGTLRALGCSPWRGSRNRPRSSGSRSRRMAFIRAASGTSPRY